MQTVKTVYQVPLLLEEAGIGNYITKSSASRPAKPNSTIGAGS